MSSAVVMILFFVCLLIAIPISVSLGIVSVLPGVFDSSFTASASYVIRSMFGGLDSFPLLAVPMFILSGIIMARGGISKRLFDLFAYFIGKRTAGLPCAAVVTCLFYGAISGSGIATVAAVGSMTIPLLVHLVMDTTPAILILTPILLPIMNGVGVDSIHFGVMMVVNLAIGFVTPPIGVNLFVASSLTDIPVVQIAKRALPMIGYFLIALILITFIPQISLALL